MNTLKLVVLGLILFFAGSTQAQISVRFNLGTPPAWGPAGYNDTRYYYLPDVEAYYDVQSSMFIYYEGRNWVHRSYLPGRYKNYDLYGGYKVAINSYHGDTPYANFKEYKSRYAKGRNREAQRNIGDRPGRGNSSAREYQQSNQVNRGRAIKNNKKGADKKRGNENNRKN